MSGPKLGRPSKVDKNDKRTEYQENVDRIAVGRAFALAKHKYGLGILVTKFDSTTRSSINLPIIAINVDKLRSTFLPQFLILEFSRYKQRIISLIIMLYKPAEVLATC